MHRSKSIVVIGAIVALLPMMGFPRAWEAFFQIAAGLSIVGLSLWSQIDKKLSQKAKAQMRQARRRATDFYPKTGQSGRRVSDLNLSSVPASAPEGTDEPGII